MQVLYYSEEVFEPQLPCLHLTPPTQRSQVTVEPDEVLLLNDPDLLPSWQRNNRLARKDAVALRTCSRVSVFAVINAVYRRALEFPRDYLQQTTWLSKWEARRALVFPADTILPSQEQTGLHTIGNSISPLHAAFMVHHCNEVIKL